MRNVCYLAAVEAAVRLIVIIIHRSACVFNNVECFSCHCTKGRVLSRRINNDVTPSVAVSLAGSSSSLQIVSCTTTISSGTSMAPKARQSSSVIALIIHSSSSIALSGPVRFPAPSTFTNSRLTLTAPAHCFSIEVKDFSKCCCDNVKCWKRCSVVE